MKFFNLKNDGDAYGRRARCFDTTIVSKDPFDMPQLMIDRDFAHGLISSFRNFPDSFSWEWRGIGAIRLEIMNVPGLKEHIHIWHPDLMLPGIAEAGNIHQHNFDMVSEVLSGKLKHKVFVADSQPGWQAVPRFHVYDFSYSTEPVADAHKVADSVLLEAPCRYWFERMQFHCAVPVDGPAVTRCFKLGIDDTTAPHVLAPISAAQVIISTPIAPLPEETRLRVVQETLAAMEKEL